jgi:hypothetical protein
MDEFPPPNLYDQLTFHPGGRDSVVERLWTNTSLMFQLR